MLRKNSARDALYGSKPLRSFHDRMTEVHTKYPEDVDVAVYNSIQETEAQGRRDDWRADRDNLLDWREENLGTFHGERKQLQTWDASDHRFMDFTRKTKRDATNTTMERVTLRDAKHVPEMRRTKDRGWANSDTLGSSAHETRWQQEDDFNFYNRPVDPTAAKDGLRWHMRNPRFTGVTVYKDSKLPPGLLVSKATLNRSRREALHSRTGFVMQPRADTAPKQGSGFLGDEEANAGHIEEPTPTKTKTSRVGMLSWNTSHLGESDDLVRTGYATTKPIRDGVHKTNKLSAKSMLVDKEAKAVQAGASKKLTIKKGWRRDPAKDSFVEDGEIEHVRTKYQESRRPTAPASLNVSDKHDMFTRIDPVDYKTTKQKTGAAAVFDSIKNFFNPKREASAKVNDAMWKTKTKKGVIAPRPEATSGRDANPDEFKAYKERKHNTRRPVHVNPEVVTAGLVADNSERRQVDDIRGRVRPRTKATEKEQTTAAPQGSIQVFEAKNPSRDRLAYGITKDATAEHADKGETGIDRAAPQTGALKGSSRVTKEQRRRHESNGAMTVSKQSKRGTSKGVKQKKQAGASTVEADRTSAQRGKIVPSWVSAMSALVADMSDDDN